MKKIVLCLLAVLIVVQPASTQNNLDNLKKQAVAEVDKLQTFTQQMVDQVFSYSELGFHEYETSKYLTGVLEKQGFKVERGVAEMPTAWVATWGSGKPVIGFITDIDCIPRASQKPGVAYHDPIVADAPGHGEGHNSGMAVNITAALVLKQLMEKNKISGTLRILPGVAEELVGSKAFFVRAGLFKDVDIVLGCHVSSEISTDWGHHFRQSDLVSVQYSFHG
ncbi:MAG: M20/M25/M40 family metallo-hydrolase, partial [Acidobacteria bacterium]|nr:M20/M25/M40 family metallo-hydrolase [Acidobacteriota bacterium]